MVAISANCCPLSQESARWDELLATETARGRDALEQWRSQSNSEARLSRALREGTGAHQLARLIQEAVAAGIKVQASDSATTSSRHAAWKLCYALYILF